MTIEEMRERKRELGYSYEQIAERTGIPLGTVQKVLGGITRSPRYETLRALEKIFEEEKASVTEEPANSYNFKKPGEYTVEDYRALPEEQRAELIDGVFYDMASPTSIHQLLTGEIYAVLRDYIRQNQGKCIPMISPLDVQLDCDQKTMVQPDVLVICDRSKLQNGIVFGAPDFVIEILSASTRKKDHTLKLSKYSEAGVREYWMIDPDRKRVIVYDLENENYVELYTFEDKVPVRIFDGNCRVDFKEIYDYVSFLYER